MECRNLLMLRQCVSVIAITVIWTAIFMGCEASPDAERLFNRLLSHHNKLIRPVEKVSELVTVKMELKLSQLVNMDEKRQIMTSNVWLIQEWQDYKLKWDPADYGGVTSLHVPSDYIWLPDIVLYNNADGNYQVTLMTKATLYYNGTVVWKPPVIYKSFCEIDIQYFPFDTQKCEMKFGLWTYSGDFADLVHRRNASAVTLENGIDLSEYSESVEWDILDVPGTRHEVYYPCCSEPYLDIMYHIKLRRKTLFYTVNLIIPCVVISFLTVLVFYLPSDSGEKVTLCVSILLALTVFFLMLIEIIPQSSLSVPMFGRYLLFTMILVTLSISVTICVLNIHFRSPATHRMGQWTQKICLEILPIILFIKRPQDYVKTSKKQESTQMFDEQLQLGANVSPAYGLNVGVNGGVYNQAYPRSRLPDDIQKAIEGIHFIAEHLKNDDEDEAIRQDWKFVAMVIDRLFLWIFTLTCIVGTCIMLNDPPSLHDNQSPITLTGSNRIAIN